MKNIRISIVFALLLSGLLTNALFVQADDDDDEYEKHEKYNDDDEDDDDSYEYEYEDEYEYENNKSYYTNPVLDEKGTWNIWTRTVVTDKETLPFTESKMVNFKIKDTQKDLNFFVIPKDGEFFVPGETVAKLLGAKSTFYKTSKILAISYQGNELIFRSGTNVVYENNVKTPIPAKAFYLNEELYLPISVITNSLGFIVEWQENNQMFLSQPLIQVGG